MSTNTDDTMTWYRDGRDRRVVNHEIGAALTEGRMFAGDRQYHLTDLEGRPVLSFYATEDLGDEEFRRSAPVDTKFSAMITIRGLNALKGGDSISIANTPRSRNEVMDMIGDAIIASVGGYDLGNPKHVLVKFVEFDE